MLVGVSEGKRVGMCVCVYCASLCECQYMFVGMCV